MYGLRGWGNFGVMLEHLWVDVEKGVGLNLRL